jgi:hypothetical protein
MDPEQAHVENAVRRIHRVTAALTAVGCGVCLILRGWRWGLAYLLGATASHLNFRWLERVVESLGQASRRRPGAKFAILMGLRYLLLAAGAYVIVNFTSLSPTAALAGLFVPVAAVILEIVFELVYASSL